MTTSDRQPWDNRPFAPTPLAARFEKNVAEHIPTVQAFLDDELAGPFLHLDPESSCATGNLRGMYEDWSIRTGNQPVSIQMFGKCMYQLGFEKVRGHGGVRRWKGLRITDY